MGIRLLRQQLFFAFLLFILFLLLVPRAGYSGDVHYWFSWSSYILEHRLGNIYQVPENNYNPLYHYFLWLFAKLMGTSEKISYYRHWMKAFPLIFDFAGAFWAASLVRDRDRRFALILLLLFNLGYLYNTLIWEQVDAIYTFFAFGAVVLAVQQRAVASALCFVLALAAKTQAIIFLPPLLLLWAPLWWQRPGRLVQAGVASVVLAVLIVAPFVWRADANYLPRIIDINRNAAGFYPQLSMNAYNLWHLLSPKPNPMEVSDALIVHGLAYRNWGLLLFFSTSVLALLPMLVAAICQLRARPHALLPTPNQAQEQSGLALVLLSCGLIPLLFCFFNTQMHERYWHAAVLFLAAYGFLRRDYLPYVLVSVAYFLNLEGALRFLELKNYGVLIFHTKFVALLFGLTIAVVFIKLYRLAALRNDWRHLWQPQLLRSAGA